MLVAQNQHGWREKPARVQLGSSAGRDMLVAQNQHGWRERPRGRNSAVPLAGTCWLCRISSDGGKTCPAAICRRAKRRLQMSSLYKAPWQGDANGHADSVRPVATGGQVRMSEARRCERCFARTVGRRRPPQHRLKLAERAIRRKGGRGTRPSCACGRAARCCSSCARCCRSRRQPTRQGSGRYSRARCRTLCSSARGTVRP